MVGRSCVTSCGASIASIGRALTGSTGRSARGSDARSTARSVGRSTGRSTGRSAGRSVAVTTSDRGSDASRSPPPPPPPPPVPPSSVAPLSSRYGLSVVSAPVFFVDGRRPRPRRGGRRLSLMRLCGEMVIRASPARAEAGLASVLSSQGFLNTERRSYDRSPTDRCARMTRCVTGYQLDATLSCRYRRGADTSRDSDDAGATARRLASRSSGSTAEAPGSSDALAGGTTCLSCRRTPRVSPLPQFGATLN